MKTLYYFILLLLIPVWLSAQTMHPPVKLLDNRGVPAMQSGNPVSTMQTCGNCHDTEFIAGHGYHTHVAHSNLPLLPEPVAQHRGADQAGDNEMNCFLCHLPEPDNAARLQALQDNQLEWANTATLMSTGLVKQAGSGYRLNADLVSPDGMVSMDVLHISSPGNNNCGACHGLAAGLDAPPLVMDVHDSDMHTTLRTGQIISPQRISESGMNIHNKVNLSRSWDVHAERLVDCVDCHFSVNNPVYYREGEATRPSHLKFDARRLDIDEYLYRPSHQFAHGPHANASGEVQPQTMRRCESCHNTEKTHNWLPYKDRHMSTMTCESCHIPYIHATALQSIDRTLPDIAGSPRLEYRGLDGDAPDAATLMQGFQPVLLERVEADSSTRLAPYNLITSWYWTTGKNNAPVPRQTLLSALVADGAYRPQVLQALDADGNGKIESAERVLNTSEKIGAISQLLNESGLDHPQIKAGIEPFAIHHSVTHGKWVTRTCETCHSDASRLAATLTLAQTGPPVKPTFVNTGLALTAGSVTQSNGAWSYTPAFAGGNLFILGYNKSMLAQILGASLFVLVLLGISVHGSIRFIALAQHKINPGPYKKVYMYSVYERFWHWMQAIAIVGLIFTGLNIHSPLVFRFMPFNIAVIIHNVLGFLLLINAALAAFYHYSSGKIKNFLPEPKGFFSQTIDQGLYYIKGIFNNEPHPFEKNVDKKLNPLQKITYLVILNILLPMQIITGIIIWGAQRWPHLSETLGGLGFLVPVHSLMAWLFAAFLILHMYLTTTGYTVTSSIRAMITGWEKLGEHK